MGDGNEHVCVHPDYSSIVASRTSPSQIHVASATPALQTVIEEMQESPPAGEAALSNPQAASSAAGKKWLFIQNILSRVRDQTTQLLQAAVRGEHAAPNDSEDGGAGGGGGGGGGGGSGDNGGSDHDGDPTDSGASDEGDSSTGGDTQGSSSARGGGGSEDRKGAADGVGQEAGCEGSWPKRGPFDEGLEEAAREHHFAQAYVQVISEPWMRKGLGIPLGQPLACQPPSLQDFTASFRVPAWASEPVRDSEDPSEVG